LWRSAAAGGPYRSIDGLTRRVRLRKGELDTLAEIGALNPLGEKMHRREALWQIERAWRPVGPLLEDGEQSYQQAQPSPLAPMSPMERLDADYRGAGLTTGPHPMRFLRKQLDALGVVRAIDLKNHRAGKQVRVAGAVITRQRPGTAQGFVFLSLEDESGIREFDRPSTSVSGSPRSPDQRTVSIGRRCAAKAGRRHLRARGSR